LQLQLPSQPVPLLADGARLSQVFANLLNNAAKYSDPGSEIVLLASAVDDMLEVQVRDHGIGLDPGQQQQIFELFTQADNAIERARGGLGIGLTLVRHLVEMHGGEVWVHSEGLGHGSEFRVRLPRESAIVPAPAPAAKDDTALPLPGNHRALVVDDNRDAADTLAMMLELMGLQVRRLYDPHGVEAEFEAFDPDVVFLDVGMPGRSGYDVAGALRALPNGRDVLMVAVTGWGQPEDRRRTSAAGFDQHLVKPPGLEAILRICKQLTDRGLAQRAPA
jgi:CheY-like chemotaxis protein